MNSQLQELLEQQGSELKQAKQLIPTLQKQVTSLTGQLQYLAEDLAEVLTWKVFHVLVILSVFIQVLLFWVDVLNIFFVNCGWNET